jgi:hypothetical protein
VDHKPAMGYFINSACPGYSFNLGCGLRSYYFNDSPQAALFLAQKRLLGFHFGVKQVGSHVLNILTACQYSDNVFHTDYSISVPTVWTSFKTKSFIDIKIKCATSCFRGSVGIGRRA